MDVSLSPDHAIAVAVAVAVAEPISTRSVPMWLVIAILASPRLVRLINILGH